MIETHKLTKFYGPLGALVELDLRIAQGEIFGFIGPNGAGKTTTMRILATLLEPTSGSAAINGLDVSRDGRQVRRIVGYMPDFMGVYDDLKVFEYLEFFAAAFGLERRTRQTVIGDVLELTQLSGKRAAAVDSLSRGMQQRLQLARVLIHDPKVLILDEPASGLDPRARVEVKALLKELRRMGKTILISSHILTELADCCTSIGIIERGRLLMHGPIDEVYRRIQGNRTVVIRFLEHAEAGLSIIRSLPETRNVEIEGNRVTVELAADENQVAALMERLVKEGVRMNSFAEKEPSLEDVFMLVTKGAVA